jgi:nicotinate phosphoribosyltransferase
MTNFVRHVLRSDDSDYIVRSRLDADFYKFTMAYFIWKFYRGTHVKFRLINRNKSFPLARIVNVDDLRRQLEFTKARMLTRTDLIWLRGQNYYHQNLFPDDFLQFLSELRLPEFKLVVDGDQFELTAEGSWESVTFWENPMMCIPNELIYRTAMREMTEEQLTQLFDNATEKLLRKFEQLKTRPWLRIADFGLRRRFMFLWQRFVLMHAKSRLGPSFTGSSNAHMSFGLDVPAIGTNAHELVMALAALAQTDAGVVDAQYEVLRNWKELYPLGGLRVVLPDAYGSQQFLANMPEFLARDIVHNWRGFRLDSGDPIAEGNMMLDWYKKMGVDPLRENKILIPSDGLDVDSIFAFDDAFKGKIAYPFGWGTNLTNDFRGCHPRGDECAVIRGDKLALSWNEIFRGHSIVCKVDSVNGRAAVKLSNNVNKATGPKEEVERYKKIFGNEGRIVQEVLV